jgi:hypothetical protein
MHSHIMNGKVYDFRFKKLVEGTYSFTLIGDKKDEDILIGTIYGPSKTGWSCVPFKNIKYLDLCPIYGLRTRLDAAMLLLKMTFPKLRDNHV